jgi:hypothetical protein
VVARGDRGGRAAISPTWQLSASVKETSRKRRYASRIRQERGTVRFRCGSVAGRAGLIWPAELRTEEHATMTGASVDPSWTGQRADRDLASIRGERERISTALVALDGHPTRRILQTAGLTGATQVEWQQAQAALDSLWANFTGYADVVERAEQVRGNRSLPERGRLQQLHWLLTAESVTVQSATGPVAQATLTAVATAMTQAYERISGLMSQVDSVWSALLPRLDQAEQTRQETLARVAEIEPALAGRLTDLATPVSQLSEALLTDPLSLAGDTRLADIEARLAAVTADLDAVVALRNDLHPRLDAIDMLIRQVAVAEAAAAAARDRAASRVDGLPLPDVPANAAALRARSARLGELVAERAWLRLASEVEAVARAAQGALAEAKESERRAAAPLQLRDELRGRLHAYQSKAIAMGLAEDPGVTRLFAAARDLLWTAPCDLGAAVSAVDRYAQQIAGRRH